MSSRFHNKFHRHNHHTTPINDPRYPDAAHDPIASPESPFQGTFVVAGGLSAVMLSAAGGQFQEIKAAVDFTGDIEKSFTIPNNITTTSTFLKIKVNGTDRYIRLWAA
jgi:hypothetical protein